MNKEYIEMIKGTLSDPASLTNEKLETFLGSTLNELLALKNKISSIDPAEREKGLKEAQELRVVLEEQIEVVCKMTGTSPDQIGPLPDEFIAEGSQAKASLENAKERFQEAKAKTAPKKKVRRNRTINILG